MNQLLVLCAFVAFTVADIQAQNSGLRERMGAKLEATTSVVKQNSCIEYSQPDPSHVFVMTDLVLDVKYTNVGDSSIILDKCSGTVSGEMLSESQQDAIANKYTHKMTKHIGVFATKPRVESDTPGELFVILKPGESYKGESMTRLLIPQDEYSAVASDVQFLRLGIWTQSGILHKFNDIAELRTRWQNLGYLWVEGVTTQPMTIQFPKLADVGKCNPDSTR